jgi:hypothetical protein
MSSKGFWRKNMKYVDSNVFVLGGPEIPFEDLRDEEAS